MSYVPLWPARTASHGKTVRILCLQSFITHSYLSASVLSVEIVGHNVGLRPARHGGARLELEEKTLSNKKLLLSPSHVKPVKEGKKVAVLHAYGIGPAGYQASIGMAQEAGAMVDSYFAKTQKAKL